MGDYACSVNNAWVLFLDGMEVKLKVFFVFFYTLFLVKHFFSIFREFYSSSSTRLFISCILSCFLVFMNIVFSIGNYLTENYSPAKETSNSYSYSPETDKVR